MAKNYSNKSKNSTANQKTGSVRIIAGKYRGRKLPVLMADGLRPTTDRVKETVFNWLMPYVVDAHCLDCFAGSGSLGFEALSRGATTAHFYELNKHASKQIADNIKLLNADNANVSHGSCLQLLTKPEQAYNLVFIDPPFRQNLVTQVADILETQNCLADDAIIYVESESELTNIAIPSDWHLLKEKVAGQVAYRLYQRQ
ncbi:16S rRNA (guanine(966)-N(2))-methyltransferase RsmD [Colwelliaceae bacterium BS250]